MVTLPEFENERMTIVSEQNENQVMMLEHMSYRNELTYSKGGTRRDWKSYSTLVKNGRR